MTLEETLEYRCYLCLAYVLGTLGSDGLGSGRDNDDFGYYSAHLTEVVGAGIDKVFSSQHVVGVFGKKRWAFTDPANGFRGDDLEARLFHDRDFDIYYLVNRPTQTGVDQINNVMTAVGAGVPDKFKQAAQLMELVRPEFRDKIVLCGLSLGGALSAYAAVNAPWPVRTIVYDPLGLNRRMMGGRGLGFFGQGEVLSDRLRSMESHVDWYYIEGSWVANLNVERHLSSVGRATELPQDPVRAERNKDTHDFRHVRYGLRRLWTFHMRNEAYWRSEPRYWSQWADGPATPRGLHTIQMEWATCSFSPDWRIMDVVRGTPLEPLTTPENHTTSFGGKFVWSYPDFPHEVWQHKVRPVVEPRIEMLVEKYKIMEGCLT